MSANMRSGGPRGGDSPGGMRPGGMDANQRREMEKRMTDEVANKNNPIEIQ